MQIIHSPKGFPIIFMWNNFMLLVPAAKKAEISEYVVRRSNEPRNEPDSSIGSTDEDLIKAHCLKLWQNM